MRRPPPPRFPIAAPHAVSRRSARGFTLVECLLACALVGVMSSLTLGAFQQQLQRAARLDAVQALMHIQQAQESHRALHGLYARDMTALRGTAARSHQGHYSIGLQDIGAEHYTAVATAMGAQMRDTRCSTLTLVVDKGYPQVGPSAGCWNR